MYIPILKTRNSEMNVAKDLNYCFSDNIIPMFEVIDKESDIKLIVDILKGKKAFVDLFRFSIDKYGNKIDLSKSEYAWRLTENIEFYISELNKIKVYNNLIPVISIKEKLEIKKGDLTQLIEDLLDKNESIAFRITDKYLEEYNDIFGKLRHTDYLMLDVGEQNLESKFIELDEFSNLEILSKKILINSPRLNGLKNGDYQTGITDNIDTSAIEKINEYSLDGFGDYAGLRDCMPEIQKGSNGRGNALALLYDYKINKFYSFMNDDKSKGMRGYKDLIPIILENRNLLDPDKDCPAFIKISEISCGNWSTWHNITARRYIHQQYKKIQQI